MDFTYINEEFKSIDHLLKELNTRKNSEIMRDMNASTKGSECFTKTKDWEEAISLLKYGYSDIVPEIKKDMKKNIKIYSKNVTMLKPMPENSPVGYVPNVPNAIMNLPNSMISVKRKPQKRKVISLVYSIGGSCLENESFFIKAGITLLTGINIIESKDIRTKLTLCFFPSKSENEVMFPTIVLKEYGQKYDLQKLCFPLAHPSMLRRIGFRYLETCPLNHDTSWPEGYGKPLLSENNRWITKTDSFKENLKLNDKDSFFVDPYWIRENNYDVIELLKSFKVK